MLFCSKDARKILNKYPELIEKQFLVEKALYKAFPNNFNILYKKNKFDFSKTCAMINSGYFKNINRDFPEPDWNKIIFHYIKLASEFLNDDFSYESICAIQDISYFNFKHIDSIFKKIKIKNLWYLRKVLISSMDVNVNLSGLKFISIKDMDAYSNTIENVSISFIENLEGLIDEEY